MSDHLELSEIVRNIINNNNYKQSSYKDTIVIVFQDSEARNINYSTAIQKFEHEGGGLPPSSFMFKQAITHKLLEVANELQLFSIISVNLRVVGLNTVR